MALLEITRARFRKVGFWLYQVHFPGFGVQKLHYFHCVFLSARWIAVNLMSQGFSYIAPVNLEYDFTDEQFDAYEEWYNAWRKLFACDAVFYVPETHTNSSAKKNGGAEKTVSEEKALGMPALPYFLRTNVPVFSAALNKKESIYIFPDKVFYLHNSKISAYDLSEVSFNVDSVNCVTDQEHLPADSKVVKETWLRVNADGSPDRRYKNNKKCLVCEYGRLRIRSDSGLNIYFLLSNSDNVDQFKAILPQ